VAFYHLRPIVSSPSLCPISPYLQPQAVGNKRFSWITMLASSRFCALLCSSWKFRSCSFTSHHVIGARATPRSGNPSFGTRRPSRSGRLGTVLLYIICHFSGEGGGGGRGSCAPFVSLHKKKDGVAQQRPRKAKERDKSQPKIRTKEKRRVLSVDNASARCARLPFLQMVLQESTEMHNETAETKMGRGNATTLFLGTCTAKILGHRP
jgi:hypothetical protein